MFNSVWEMVIVLHRALIEMLRVSGGLFMLFCSASAICMVLLILLTISFVRLLGRRTVV